MINIPKPRYFDRDGNELPSNDHDDAYYTQVGSARTRRDGCAQKLVDGKWVDVYEQPPTGSR